MRGAIFLFYLRYRYGTTPRCSLTFRLLSSCTHTHFRGIYLVYRIASHCITGHCGACICVKPGMGCCAFAIPNNVVTASDGCQPPMNFTKSYQWLSTATCLSNAAGPSRGDGRGRRGGRGTKGGRGVDWHGQGEAVKDLRGSGTYPTMTSFGVSPTITNAGGGSGVSAIPRRPGIKRINFLLCRHIIRIVATM